MLYLIVYDIITIMNDASTRDSNSGPVEFYLIKRYPNLSSLKSNANVFFLSKP